MNYLYMLIPIFAICAMVFFDFLSKKKKEQHRQEKRDKLFKQLKNGEIDEDEYDYEMNFLDFD